MNKENTFVNNLANIPMSIKLMQQLENCCYSTAQRRLKAHRKAFMAAVPGSVYTVLDYCINTGRKEEFIALKLKLKMK